MHIETDETPILSSKTYSRSEWITKSKNGVRLNLGEVARYNHNIRAFTQAILDHREEDREETSRRRDLDPIHPPGIKLRPINGRVKLPKRFRKGIK